MIARHHSWTWALAAAALVAGGCVSKPSFTCGGGKSCGTGGLCVDGACAFADATCSSGFRFDTSATSGRANSCVADGLDLSVDNGDDMGGGIGPDFAQLVDIAGADLTCTPTGAEDCFDGVDNDCNGMTDCMDPACNAIAECVPGETGWQLGTHVPTGSGCPAHFTAQTTTVNNGLSAPLTCTGCTCSPSLTCSVSISEMVANMCPNGSLVANESLTADNNHCENKGGVSGGWDFTTANVRVGPIVTKAQCAGSGTPAPTAATWSSTVDFCETTQIGGGCNAGFVCVPKVTTPQRHCILQAGNVACPGNYAAEGTEPWYTGVTDTRSCGSSCNICSSSGGTCGTKCVIHAFLGSTCTGSADFLAANGDDCGQSSPLESFNVQLGNDAVNPSCSPNYPTSGSATPTGAQTLCCL